MGSWRPHPLHAPPQDKCVRSSLHVQPVAQHWAPRAPGAAVSHPSGGLGVPGRCSGDAAGLARARDKIVCVLCTPAVSGETRDTECVRAVSEAGIRPRPRELASHEAWSVASRLSGFGSCRSLTPSPAQRSPRSADGMRDRHPPLGPGAGPWRPGSPQVPSFTWVTCASTPGQCR